MKQDKRVQLFAMVVILLLAAAGRIINIDNESLWVDEGFSYWAIRHDDMFNLVISDVHPPIYFYMLRGWVQFTGITELALRYFSVIPSLLSVVMVYHVARELLRQTGQPHKHPIIPLLAALLLALADMENYIAQETRMYTWHVLWAIVSMWAFLRWVRLQRAIGLWIAASVLLVYTHYIGTAALAVQGLYALLFLRGSIRRSALAALLFIGLTFIPWLLVVVSNQTENVGTGYNVPSTLASLWDWRVNWFTQQWPLLMGLSLLGLFKIRYQQGKSTVQYPDIAASALLLAWFSLPVMGAYILNQYTPILMDYRLTQITPAVALMIAFGLGKLERKGQALLIVAIVLYGVTTDDTAIKRPPWRTVGQHAAQFAQSGDLALTHITPSGDWQVMYYYERFMPPGVTQRSLRQWQMEDSDTYAEGLPALLTDYPHVWFMHWSKDQSGFDALAATGHIQTAVMTTDWLGNDLNVYRFDVVPPPADALIGYTSGMILRDVAVIDNQLRVDLWWSAEATRNQDYTVSVFLLDANGQLVAQHDAQPFQRSTSTWQSGEVIYDPHVLSLSENLEILPDGEYQVGVRVYQWTPEELINQPTSDGDEFALITTYRHTN